MALYGPFWVSMLVSGSVHEKETGWVTGIWKCHGLSSNLLVVGRVVTTVGHEDMKKIMEAARGLI